VQQAKTLDSREAIALPRLPKAPAVRRTPVAGPDLRVDSHVSQPQLWRPKMDEEREGTLGGSIPEFDLGLYELDDHGRFRPKQDDFGARLQENDYSRRKPILCRYLMYHQRGRCLECGITEWAVSPHG
jgi:hypothetical protein